MTRARLLVVAAVLLGTVAPAMASDISSDVTGNWSGYVAVPVSDPSTGIRGTFSGVSATWVQPRAGCGSAAVGTSSSSAFWVGLGGNSSSAKALEQIGTEVDCTAGGARRYSAWYELVPALSRTIQLVVAPGDRISASVTVAGRRVTLSLRNLTRRTSFSRVLRMAAPDTSSAEWIAEAPSACSSSSDCRQRPLTNFGTVRFSSATATDGKGHSGAISNGSWRTTALTLESETGPGFGHFRAEATPQRVTPGPLTNRGTGFTLTWSSAPSARGTEPAPGGPGYG